MSTCMIVANQTLLSPVLRAAINERTNESSRKFHVVVPMSAAGRNFTWDEDESRRQATERLEAFLAGLRGMGLEVTGEIGDRDPVQAVRDSLRSQNEVDEIILSTFPPGISRWLGEDVPGRLRDAVPVPVAVIYDSARATAPTP